MSMTNHKEGLTITWPRKALVRQLRRCVLEGGNAKGIVESAVRCPAHRRYLEIYLALFSHDAEKLSNAAVNDDSQWLRYTAVKFCAKLMSTAQLEGLLPRLGVREAKLLVKQTRNAALVKVISQLYPDEPFWLYLPREQVTADLVEHKLASKEDIVTAFDRHPVPTLKALCSMIPKQEEDQEWFKVGVTTVIRRVSDSKLWHRGLPVPVVTDFLKIAHQYKHEIDTIIRFSNSYARSLLDEGVLTVDGYSWPCSAAQYIKWHEIGAVLDIDTYHLGEIRCPSQEKVKIIEHFLAKDLELEDFQLKSGSVQEDFWRYVEDRDLARRLAQRVINDKEEGISTAIRYRALQTLGNEDEAVAIVCEDCNSSDERKRQEGYRALMLLVQDRLFKPQHLRRDEYVRTSLQLDSCGRLAETPLLPLKVRNILDKLLRSGLNERSYVIASIHNHMAHMICTGRIDREDCVSWWRMFALWPKLHGDAVRFMEKCPLYVRFALKEGLLNEVKLLMQTLFHKCQCFSAVNWFADVPAGIWEDVVLSTDLVDMKVKWLCNGPPEKICSSPRIWTTWAASTQNPFSHIPSWNCVIEKIRWLDRQGDQIVRSIIVRMIHQANDAIIDPGSIHPTPILHYLLPNHLRRSATHLIYRHIRPWDLSCEFVCADLVPNAILGFDFAYKRRHLQYLRKCPHPYAFVASSLYPEAPCDLASIYHEQDESDPTDDIKLYKRGNDSRMIQQEELDRIISSADEIDRSDIASLVSFMQSGGEATRAKVSRVICTMMTRPPSISKRFIDVILILNNPNTIDILIDHLTVPGVHQSTRLRAFDALLQFRSEPRMWELLNSKLILTRADDPQTKLEPGLVVSQEFVTVLQKFFQKSDISRSDLFYSICSKVIVFEELIDTLYSTWNKRPQDSTGVLKGYIEKFSHIEPTTEDDVIKKCCRSLFLLDIEYDEAQKVREMIQSYLTNEDTAFAREMARGLFAVYHLKNEDAPAMKYIAEDLFKHSGDHLNEIVMLGGTIGAVPLIRRIFTELPLVEQTFALMLMMRRIHLITVHLKFEQILDLSREYDGSTKAYIETLAYGSLDYRARQKWRHLNAYTKASA